MNLIDDETLQIYVEEAEEHLADIEKDLLTIESMGSELDDEIVNKVFRAAHSIKGGAGFLGFDNIKELAHRLENVLGLIRDKEIIPTPDNVNILLLGFDKLSDLMNNISESNDIDIEEHIVSLANLTTAVLPVDERSTLTEMKEILHVDGRPIFSLSEFDISQSRKGGKFFYLIEYDLIKDVQEKSKTPYEILDLLQKSGEIVECKIDISSVGTLEDGDPLQLPFIALQASIIEQDIISNVLDIEKDRIFIIPENTFKAIPLNSEPAVITENTPGHTEPETSVSKKSVSKKSVSEESVSEESVSEESGEDLEQKSEKTPNEITTTQKLHPIELTPEDLED